MASEYESKVNTKRRGIKFRCLDFRSQVQTDKENKRELKIRGAITVHSRRNAKCTRIDSEKHTETKKIPATGKDETDTEQYEPQI